MGFGHPGLGVSAQFAVAGVEAFGYEGRANLGDAGAADVAGLAEFVASDHAYEVVYRPRLGAVV